jgi:pseudaminic acid synthase
MRQEVQLGSLKVGPDHPPLVVAEMSGNHNASLERALALVEAAAAAGARALKLQTYTADTMTIDVKENEFTIDDPESLWQGYSLHDLYKKAYTPWEWHGEIFARCRELGMEAFSTPFDETAVDFLLEHDVPCFKIASFENTDLPLIARAAATGKPLIISTGMATAEELAETATCARDNGCRDLILLKCTSTYPAEPTNSNIRTMADLARRFDCLVGISDHTMGIGVSVAAVGLGAVLVEKHFTLDRDDGGVDSQFSIEPHELKLLVEETRRAWQGLGEVRYGPTRAEQASLRHRRSLYIVADVAAGESLTRENVRCIRPGLGLAPKYLDAVLGRKTKRNLTRGTPLSWDDITEE